MNYYNEWDKPTAAWLAQLASDGHVPAGHVDTRSITEITPDELDGYTQHHFFAGIGGWPLALDLAGWPRDRAVWTGSCPCQPFSAAGSRKGTSDERHLWPEMFRLIRECRPATVIGEQVASAVAHGWLDGVFADLEAIGYSCGAVVLGAHSVGAPHKRQRLFWVADTGTGRLEQHTQRDGGQERRQQARPHRNDIERRGDLCRLADAGRVGARIVTRHGDQASCRQPIERTRQTDVDDSGRGTVGGLGNATGNRRIERWSESRRSISVAGTSSVGWNEYTIIPCGDGKTRRIKPGISALVDGVPARMVVVCSTCKTETTLNEELHYMRNICVRNEGLSSAEVLFDTVLENKPICSISKGRTRSSSQADNSNIMQQVWSNNASSSAPQRSQPPKQQSQQHRNSVREVPWTGTFTGAEAVNMRGVWESIRSKGPQVESEDMFCPVCDRVGPHMCKETMGGSRIVQLRGYGNAIVPQLAAEFVRAFMETQP